MPLGAWRLNGLAKYSAGVAYTPASFNGESSNTSTRAASNSNITFGTGNFTWEAWVYITIDFGSTATNIIQMGTSNADTSDVRLSVGAGTNNFWFRVGGSGGTTVQGTTIWNLNTWYHVALVRNSGSCKMYVNGTNEGSTATFTTNLASRQIGIGRITYAGTRCMPGNIDEVRISSVARYTSNFTAPSSPFTDDSNTLSLLHWHDYSGTTVYDDNSSGRSSLDYTIYGGAYIDTTDYKF